MKKLRIGILIRDLKTLKNWELRIIEKIKDDSNLELILLIKDRRVGKAETRSNRNTLSEFLFKKQISLEKKRYLSNMQVVKMTDIIKYLKTIPSIDLKPKRKEKSDIFSKEDYHKIKKFNLDIILKHGFNIINGDILNAAKYGIWLLVHGDNTKIAGPPGLWEIVTKQPVVSAALLQLTKQQDEGLLIDKAYYNRHKFSFVETNTKVIESTVSLLFKNFKKITNELYSKPDRIIKFDSYSNLPDLKNTLKYFGNYYNSLFNGLLKKGFVFFGKRIKSWTLFIGKGNFMDSELSNLKPVKLPKDEFWADPFLFKYHGQHYVFFENFSYKSKRGKISCGKVINNELVDIIDVLDLNYHLSYPFIFEEAGDIFMMPETSENRRLEIYKCINFPSKWELYSTAFEGENVADAFFYNDKQKQKWLFINKIVTPNTDSTSELYIYKVDSLKLKKLESHKQNPVLIDSRVARNGGVIFEYKDKIYRPSQSNTDGIYGKALNINQIIKLTLDEYKEKTVRKVEHNSKNRFFKMHHLHQIDEMFIFDATH